MSLLDGYGEQETQYSLLDGYKQPQEKQSLLDGYTPQPKKELKNTSTRIKPQGVKYLPDGSVDTEHFITFQMLKDLKVKYL